MLLPITKYVGGPSPANIEKLHPNRRSDAGRHGDNPKHLLLNGIHCNSTLHNIERLFNLTLYQFRNRETASPMLL